MIVITCNVLEYSKLDFANTTLTFEEFKEYFQLYGVTECY
jgi:hypothetical protein